MENLKALINLAHLSEREYDLVTGSIKVTFDDIKSYMVDKITKLIDESEYDREDDGYCPISELTDYQYQWSNMSEHSFVSDFIVSDYSEIYAMDGGRDYIISGDDFILLLHNYLKYTHTSPVELNGELKEMIDFHEVDYDDVFEVINDGLPSIDEIEREISKDKNEKVSYCIDRINKLK